MREIGVGACFYHNDDLYMKTDETTGVAGFSYRVVRLSDGKADRLTPDIRVTPVRTKVEVRDIA